MMNKIIIELLNHYSIDYNISGNNLLFNIRSAYFTITHNYGENYTTRIEDIQNNRFVRDSNDFDAFLVILKDEIDFYMEYFNCIDNGIKPEWTPTNLWVGAWCKDESNDINNISQNEKDKMKKKVVNE